MLHIFKFACARARPSSVLYGAASLFSAVFAFHHATTPIHLDAAHHDVLGKFPPCDTEICQPCPTLVDPATSVEFPKQLRVPSKFPLPPHSLLGVGVRTVSFLGIHVYSVGFYADLTAPKLKVRLSAMAWAPILTREDPDPQ